MEATNAVCAQLYGNWIAHRNGKRKLKTDEKDGRRFFTLTNERVLTGLSKETWKCKLVDKYRKENVKLTKINKLMVLLMTVSICI